MGDAAVRSEVLVKETGKVPFRRNLPAKSCSQLFEKASFSASGEEAMEIQERMFEVWSAKEQYKTTLMFGLSALFGVMSFLLVMFGPASRSMSVNIFSLSFLLLSAGIAGFTQIRGKSLGNTFEASQKPDSK